MDENRCIKLDKCTETQIAVQNHSAMVGPAHQVVATVSPAVVPTVAAGLYNGATAYDYNNDLAGQVYPLAEPYVDVQVAAEEETAAEPYIHEEIAAEHYVHVEPIVAAPVIAATCAASDIAAAAVDYFAADYAAVPTTAAARYSIFDTACPPVDDKLSGEWKKCR